MEQIILSTEQKKQFCKIISAPILSEYLVSIQGKCFMDVIKDFFSYDQVEINCDLPQEMNNVTKLSFNPNQRKTIIAKIKYLKETTRFTWYLRSNRQIEFELLLNSLNISFRCLEN